MGKMALARQGRSRPSPAQKLYNCVTPNGVEAAFSPRTQRSSPLDDFDEPVISVGVRTINDANPDVGLDLHGNTPLGLGWVGAATGAVRAPGIYRGAVDQMSTAPRLLRAALARSGLILGLGSLRHGIRKRCRSRVHASDAAVITAGQPSCVRGA